MARFALRAGFTLAATVLALALLEVGLRLVGFSYELAATRVEFGWPDPPSIEARYRSDPDLFWVPKDYAQKLERLASQRPQLVFLGDSCTEFGFYPEFFLERVRQAHPDLEIVGEELGTGGWSSYQGVRQMERDVVALRPRAVTVYFGWNDHWIGFGVRDDEINALRRSPLQRVGAERVAQLVFQARLGLRARLQRDPPRRVPPDDFRSNLAEIARLARSRDIVPVLVTAPTSHEWGREPKYLERRWLRDLSRLVPLHQEYVQIVREVAAEEDAVLCDLAERFEALPRPDLRHRYFQTDGMHLRPDGDAKLAEFLYECFQAEPALHDIWNAQVRSAASKDHAPIGR